MIRCQIWRFLHLLCIVALATTISLSVPMSSELCAQDNNDGGDNGGDNADDGAVDDGEPPAGGAGGDVVFTEQAGAGVVVNARGVLRVKRNIDRTGKLDRKRRKEAFANLNPDVAKTSELRKVSLNRLERVVGRNLADGMGLTQDMLYLAGLKKIQYVFFYPETNDIVIAGPAEGYMLDEMQRPFGINSGESVLQLEDLIVALRAYGPSRQPQGTVGCSIDPTQEGLQRMQNYLVGLSKQKLNPGQSRQIADGLQKSLGKQVVSIKGISPNTHFANVLVEADYRMKLIGIGLEKPPVRITSYIKRASPSSVARNAMQRWYFVPDYECVHVTDDGLGAELVGEGVKLVNANELVRSDGTRATSGKANRASQAFVESFTRHYAQLAKKAPVYAQLRDLIDMLIVAALIQDQDFYSQAGWEMKIFGSEDSVPVQKYTAPKQVETAVNAVFKGRTLMTPIGGGVHINAREAISAGRVKTDEDGSIAEQHKTIDLNRLAKDQWWWD